MPKLLKSLIFHVGILFGLILPRNELKQPCPFLFATTVRDPFDLFDISTDPRLSVTGTNYSLSSRKNATSLANNLTNPSQKYLDSVYLTLHIFCFYFLLPLIWGRERPFGAERHQIGLKMREIVEFRSSEDPERRMNLSLNL
jgi:hypothetical protein